MAEIAVGLNAALQRRDRLGEPGRTHARVMAQGPGCPISIARSARSSASRRDAIVATLACGRIKTMPTTTALTRSVIAIAVLSAFTASARSVSAQDDPGPARRTENRNGPWFGLTPPPAPGAEPAVVVGDRAPRPVHVPSDAPSGPELQASALRADLTTIVGISKESRADEGDRQRARCGAASPASRPGAKTVDWAARAIPEGRHRGRAACSRSRRTRNAPLLAAAVVGSQAAGDPAFGAGTTDVVLQSAIPVAPSEHPGRHADRAARVRRPASPAVLEHIDVKGKIAVQLIVPQGHMLFERGAVPNARRR